MSKLRLLIREMVEQELDEMARISTNIKVGDKEKFNATKELYANTWLEDLLKHIEDAGENGISQPELAKRLGKGGMQAINPKIRSFIESGIITKGDLSTPKKEKAPSTGQRGRPKSEKVKVATDLDAKFKEDPNYTPTEEETSLLGAEFIDKLRKRAKGELKRGRKVGSVAKKTEEPKAEDTEITDKPLEETINENKKPECKCKESKKPLNEQFIKMQKLAGIIK